MRRSERIYEVRRSAIELQFKFYNIYNFDPRQRVGNAPRIKLVDNAIPTNLGKIEMRRPRIENFGSRARKLQVHFSDKARYVPSLHRACRLKCGALRPAEVRRSTNHLV